MLIQETLVGHRTYHIAWTCYVVFLALFGSGLIAGTSGLGFVDSLFTSTSAVVNAGLGVVDVNTLPKSTFTAIGFLMLFGSGGIMLLPTLIYRCICLRNYIPLIDEKIKSSSLTEENRDILTEYRNVYYASQVLAVVIAAYIISWILIGSFCLTGALMTKPMEPALADLGFSYYQIALFTSISAFTNSGLTVSNSSLVYEGENHGALFVITNLILAGNVFLPVYLRWSLRLLWRLAAPRREYAELASRLKYILDNPRRLTTQLFDHDSTVYLVQVAIISNAIVFGFFLVSDSFRRSMQVYGDDNTEALGLFQIVNLRHAGFQVFNMRDMSQDMLFVMALAMYLSPIPGIGLMHKSG